MYLRDGLDSCLASRYKLWGFQLPKLLFLEIDSKQELDN
jgi:hypothetical protein